MIQALILVILGGLGAPEIGIIVIVLLLMMIPKIFYLITLQKTLEKISPENRTMPSTNVWLELIPLFNIVWQFFNVINVSDSIKKEYESKGIVPDEIRPGYSIGITFCVLSCCSIIPFLGFLAGIGSVICWIIFWVKISNYKNRL